MPGRAEIRLALLVQRSGTSGWRRACTCWRPLTSRQTLPGSGAAFDDARHPVHQDLLARRRDPSHAGADGGAAPTAGRAVLLGRGGGVCTARTNSSRRLGRHSSRIAPRASARRRGAPLGPSTWAEVAGFRRAVRARRYDDIIDPQGLVRSALMTRLARGRRHGYDANSIRERAASWFYDVRHRVARDLHAI